jgi:biopolymer transport protein ExbB
MLYRKSTPPAFWWLAMLIVLVMSADAASRAQAPNTARSEADDAIHVPAEPAEGSASPAPLIAHKNLFEILRSGGMMMIPLFACSFILTVFVFEKVISLRRGRVIPAPFVNRFLPQLREGKLDRDQAIELCEESKSPVADVFAGAVKKWGRPAVEVEQALIDAGERTAHRLRRYLRLFNGIATVSPLLGLLGTVFGMIHLFNAIATADAMGRTELLAGGISEALLTTAAGLGVAIPAVCSYLLFLGRVDQLLVDLDALGQELVDLISAEALQEDRGKAARSRKAAA